MTEDFNKILVIYDDPQFREAASYALQGFLPEGWQVASYLREYFPEIYLICFSRANLGEMGKYADATFLRKLDLLDAKGSESATAGLRGVISTAIEILKQRTTSQPASAGTSPPQPE